MPILSRARRSRLAALIPPEPAAPPVRYSTPLVLYVGVVCTVAFMIAVATVSAPHQLPVLGVGAVAIVVVDLLTVRSLSGVLYSWSPAVFVHLALTLTVGPVGALVAAAVGSPARAVRLRMGWFRAAFNFANFFVSDMAALGMFDAMRNVSRASLWVILACGAAIGFVSYAVNHTLLAVIVHISTPKELRTVLLSSRGILPYEIACGVGATTFSLAPASDRAAILVGWLVLVVALQTLMVQLARRARERLELLQRIIDVAEMERFKIAADLHDGPVSALAGIAMALGERREADELRTVQRELRDLIFQYSPHDLDRQGRLRQEVSEKQAAPLREQGVDVQVAIPDTVPLDRSGLELLHRVCGEALRNVLGHANASHVTVFVAAESDAVLLTISDDGRGFSMQDVARQRASGHFGTRFLEEKATIAGGAFDIRSAPGQGTRVRLNLPIVDSPLVP